MKASDLDLLDELDGVQGYPEYEWLNECLAGIRQSINGAKSWGLSDDERFALTGVRLLRDALVGAEKADEAQRALAGERMAHGRTKKKLHQLQEDYDHMEHDYAKLLDECNELKKQLAYALGADVPSSDSVQDDS